MLPIKVIISIWFLVSVCESHENENIISITENFLKLQKTPLKITSFLCWNEVDLWKFVRNLGDKYFIRSSRSFNSYLQSNVHHQLFILDLNCEGSVKILDLAKKSGFLNAPFRWLIFGNKSLITDESLDLELSSRIYLIEPDFEIVAPYKYSKKSQKIVKNVIGKWNFRENRIDNYNEISISRNRTNLMGTTLIISYVVTNPETLDHLWDYRNVHIDPITKHSYILIHHLMDYLNATKEFVMRNTWGYKNATTGLYSGLSGDLQARYADLGGTPLFFLQDRLEVLEYIASPTPTFMRFIFKAPPLSYVKNVYTLPFDARVWHYSFVMVAVLGLSIYLIVLWEWKDPKFRSRIEKAETESISALKPNVFDVVMLQIGAVSQQGSDVEPKSNSGRIATIFAFTVLMFMYTSYSANIVALLQSTTDSIKSLRDLYDSKMKLGAEDLVYQHHYFESEKDPLRKLIYEQRVAQNFLTSKEGMRKVQDGFFAFHIELSSGYKFVSEMYHEHEKCQLREVTFLTLNAPGLPIPKKSEYAEVFKVGLKKIQESGLQSREFNRIYIKKPTCGSQGSSFQSVGLVDCYSAFLFFAVGLAMAIFLVAVEIAHRNYQLRQRIRN